ncbi:hypothetical protein MPF19_14125 [Polaribacter sp. Z014]|uniref:hypothetical protein n=1 Tax=Polaribacter sp. Z014 TaxID=2927126 RepID=UPI002020A88C|nr:hypothetical protein [Polaribacter sp. Z014]MCL7764556.1 hypothetical protein [Polaribacter sp. Z014]
MKKYSILVNTCDKFEDCWDPFFKLFSIYWPDYEGTIYLNTEYKGYSYGNLNIIAVKGALKNNIPKTERATWSDCFKWALETMNEDIVLYMQEDYFLNKKMDSNTFNTYVNAITTSKSIDCIHLTDKSAGGDELFTINDLKLYSIPKHHKDRVSCQAALWKKEVLKSYLKPYESGWNFEWWGSKRAAYINHNFYTTNNNVNSDNGRNIIPYEVTGVIGGKWYPGVVQLFKDHNIEMDFSKRGFFESKTLTFNERLNAKLKRLPVEVKSYIDLLKLKYS